MQITLERWGTGDPDLLRRLNTPEMTAYLGGPESEEKLLARDAKYIEYDTHADAGIHRVLVDGAAVGSVNFWPSEWRGEAVYEIGWGIVTAFQGRGVAATAVSAALEAARSQHAYPFVHAFPNVENAASNAVCRRAGFTLLGPVEIEYPAGSPMAANDWVIDLDSEARASPRAEFRE